MFLSMSILADLFFFFFEASEHHTMYQYSLIGAKNHYLGLIQTETVSLKWTSWSVLLMQYFQPYYQPAPAAPAPFITNPTYHDPIFGPSTTSAWGLYVQKSSSIVVYGKSIITLFRRLCRSEFIHSLGAGHYSFFQVGKSCCRSYALTFRIFQNYDQTCYSSQTCQNQIVSIDSSSAVQVYSLTTVGTTYQLSLGGQPIINSTKGLEKAGQESTVTFWGPSSAKRRAHPYHKRHGDVFST